MPIKRLRKSLQYQPDASANFIYSVCENVENQQQYISFLCNTPAQATKGQFVDLNDLEKLEFVDSALESMVDALSQRKPF